VGDRQLSIREWCDIAYTILVDSIRGHDESLYKAIERADDLFLTPQELARKQNAEAFSKLKIPPPRPGGQKVTPLA
jgi:hypothetical protein